MEENATFSIFYVACVLEKNMTNEAANSDVPAFFNVSKQNGFYMVD